MVSKVKRKNKVVGIFDVEDVRTFLQQKFAVGVRVNDIKCLRKVTVIVEKL